MGGRETLPDRLARVWARLPRLLAGLTLVSAVAYAQPSRADATRPIGDAITVAPGATCLDATTLAEHVGGWLGADALAADIDVQVEGSPDDPRAVRFEAFRRGRSIAARRFDPGPASCENLHAAVGLAIAMALSPALIHSLAPPPPVATRAAPAPAPPAPPSWALGVSALATFDVLAGIALGAEVRVERALGPWLALRIGAFGVEALPASFDGVSGQYDTGLVAGRTDTCAGGEAARQLRIQACAGFTAGALWARGHAFTVSKTAVVSWMAIANELHVLAGLGPQWSLEGSVGVLLPLRRMSFAVVDPSGAVVGSRDLGPVGGLVSLGVTYPF